MSQNGIVRHVRSIETELRIILIKYKLNKYNYENPEFPIDNRHFQ